MLEYLAYIDLFGAKHLTERGKLFEIFANAPSSDFFSLLTHNNKTLFASVFLHTGGAQRITKTALGGFISFLFVSSLLSFTSYAITTYVKDNEDVTKVTLCFFIQMYCVTKYYTHLILR